MLERIESRGMMLALIIRADYHDAGIQFFTPASFSQQLAYMNRAAGYVIAPHVHNPVARSVHLTQEVLIIRSGEVELDLYDEDKNYVDSRILRSGDVVLLAHGGHGFTMLQDSEIVEVKQGPYAGDADKTRFEPAKVSDKKSRSV